MEWDKDVRQREVGRRLRWALQNPLDGELRGYVEAPFGLPQQVLAQRLGTSQSVVSTWVNGLAMPRDPAMLLRVEIVLGCQPGSLTSPLGYGPPVIRFGMDCDPKVWARAVGAVAPRWPNSSRSRPCP